jgi:hypothetical protein
MRHSFKVRRLHKHFLARFWGRGKNRTTPQPPTGGSTTTTAMNIDHEGKSYLKKPKPFDGNRRKVDDFIYACDLFFEGSSNKDFPTDKQKIIFILSYMSEGEAQQWKKNYIETIIRQADGTYTWPTKAAFLAAFKAAFQVPQ